MVLESLLAGTLIYLGGQVGRKTFDGVAGEIISDRAKKVREWASKKSGIGLKEAFKDKDTSDAFQRVVLLSYVHASGQLLKTLSAERTALDADTAMDAA